MPKARHIITLHVHLTYLSPRIWRRIEVDGDVTLRQLHAILQAAFGWDNAHLYEFNAEGKRYSVPDEDGFALSPDHAVLDDRRIKLESFAKAGGKFSYTYDYGDNWEHTVTIESVDRVGEKVGHAYVIAGERAAPPEDCGGAGRYGYLLELLKKPAGDDELEEFLDWMGGPFDPSHFDRHAANAELRSLAPPKRRK